MLIFYFLNLWYSDHKEEKDLNLKRNDNENFFVSRTLLHLSQSEFLYVSVMWTYPQINIPMI